DTVSAVTYQEPLAVANQAYRRRAPALLEPLPIPLHRRLADALPTALADSNLGQRHPDRLGSAQVLAHGSPPFEATAARTDGPGNEGGGSRTRTCERLRTAYAGAARRLSSSATATSKVLREGFDEDGRSWSRTSGLSRVKRALWPAELLTRGSGTRGRTSISTFRAWCPAG